MKALVYLGPNQRALEDRPKPVNTAPTEAVVKMTRTTICGTDLHIQLRQEFAAGEAVARAADFPKSSPAGVVA